MFYYYGWCSLVLVPEPSSCGRIKSSSISLKENDSIFMKQEKEKQGLVISESVLILIRKRY